MQKNIKGHVTNWKIISYYNIKRNEVCIQGPATQKQQNKQISMLFVHLPFATKGNTFAIAVLLK